MKLLNLLLLALILTGCIFDPPSGILKINNESNSTVYVYLTCSDSLSPDLPLKVYFPKAVKNTKHTADSVQAYVLPKFNLPIQKKPSEQDSILANAVDYYPYNRINAKTVVLIAIGGSPEKPQLVCENDQINIFIIKESTLQHNTWDEICKKKLYEQRKKLNSKQLESDNWQVVFSSK